MKIVQAYMLCHNTSKAIPRKLKMPGLGALLRRLQCKKRPEPVLVKPSQTIVATARTQSPIPQQVSRKTCVTRNSQLHNTDRFHAQCSTSSMQHAGKSMASSHASHAGQNRKMHTHLECENRKVHALECILACHSGSITQCILSTHSGF